MALTIKTDEATQESYQKMFLAAKEIDPELTTGKFFAEVVRKMQQSTPETSPVHLSNYVLKETHDEIHDLYIQYHNLIQKINNTLNDDPDREVLIENIPEEIRKIKQRGMMVPEIEYVPEALKENEIRFEIPEPHLSLLNETKKRLSQKFDRNVTIKDILLDMFARYTIEKYNEWFYPFVIREEDFEKVTGYSYNDLKLWLKAKTQA